MNLARFHSATHVQRWVTFQAYLQHKCYTVCKQIFPSGRIKFVNSDFSTNSTKFKCCSIIEPMPTFVNIASSHGTSGQQFCHGFQCKCPDTNKAHQQSYPRLLISANQPGHKYSWEIFLCCQLLKFQRSPACTVGSQRAQYLKVDYNCFPSFRLNQGKIFLWDIRNDLRLFRFHVQVFMN